MPFTAWKCSDCGASGSVRHDRGELAGRVAQLVGASHAGKSPACHQKGLKNTVTPAGLTPRERHILITARTKRKVLADMLRTLRVGPDRVAKRKEWVAGMKSRKGYCAT